MKKVKTAIIGAGLIGEIHAETYSSYEKSELGWICDINHERAELLADRYGCRSTTNAA